MFGQSQKGPLSKEGKYIPTNCKYFISSTSSWYSAGFIAKCKKKKNADCNQNRCPYLSPLLRKQVTQRKSLLATTKGNHIFRLMWTGREWKHILNVVPDGGDRDDEPDEVAIPLWEEDYAELETELNIPGMFEK